ncbi:Com family DNA-binding transcriptional regulator [Stenotrophomonas rhizophila]|uniref:Com family DNA-binding transcriptional regulator n=1 Tax=Stenotrophomonas rhizophila TaxID=216778 RepID=UPI0035161AB6
MAGRGGDSVQPLRSGGGDEVTAVLKTSRCGHCARLLARPAGNYDSEIKCGP